MNTSYQQPGGHPMRRFAVFAAVFAGIVVAGTMPWHNHRGLFRAHASRIPHVVDAVAATGANGWSVTPCTGEDSDQTYWGWGRNVRVCEMRSITIATPGKLDVTGENGGIHVLGEDRNNVVIEARVEGRAGSKEDARSILEQVQVTANGGVVRDQGPHSLLGNRGYTVSYTIHAPRQLSATLKTMNGGIELRHLTGDLDFDTVNGGVELADLAGDTHGSTVNGGLDISLSGSQWQGQGLNVHTTNGGVTLNLPDNYSAHLEAGTVNGGIELGFPVTVQGEIKHHLSTDIGHGGATIHAETVNGGVVLSRSGKGNEAE